MTVREEIAKNLAFYRKQCKITQKELAEMVDVKKTAVSNWEQGRNSVDIDTLCQICKIFKVSISDMFGSYANIGTNTDKYTPTEKQLITDYRQLSEQGQESIRQQMVLHKNTYKKSNSDANMEKEVG